mmetsp:Transcript_14853/g.28604  ORF Transcript_14853/g.28604 Transcript_14853/m.28604 type:complete len:382 (-) Transcript_14853:445-1590(-)|eukprot:CAMPEP_0114253322 /NCGR_PEP_ID=MMETSP0058-20121206/16325_1 /TAXON_ID=36894 /ORGANISM="Pyramimonas parkeae, CCMP726" /LENGTH=381 /DNA_ID=CAMNT_0001367349 /DNA_START=130 /DNA_END=1275 /DNA_ORIENTATION=-
MAAFLTPLRRALVSASSIIPRELGAYRSSSNAAAGAQGSLSQFRVHLDNGPTFADFLRSDEPYAVNAPTPREKTRKPDWLKRVVPKGEEYIKIKSKLRGLKLATVCEEAKCPNIGECWAGGEGHIATATIMVMGDTCTRGCRFCAVKTARAPPPLDPMEPANTAAAVASWGVGYIVVTSVDRDDLPDQGSNHISLVVQEMKKKSPELLVEVLSPDFSGDMEGVDRVALSGLDVFAHNVETVPRLTPHVRDHRAGWAQSLKVLKRAKQVSGKVTKTSIMLGLGERPEEIQEALEELRANDVDVVTFGQYMRPTKRHMPVVEYITPEGFAHWQKVAEGMGFRYVASGAMVRSSYRAGELYLKGMIESEKVAKAQVVAPRAAAA